MGLDQPSRLVECKRRAAPTGRSGLKPGRLGFPVVVLRTSDRHRPQSWAGPAMSYSSPPQSPDGVGHDRWRPRTAMPFSSFRIGIAAGEPPAGHVRRSRPDFRSDSPSSDGDKWLSERTAPDFARCRQEHRCDVCDDHPKTTAKASPHPACALLTDTSISRLPSGMQLLTCFS